MVVAGRVRLGLLVGLLALAPALAQQSSTVTLRFAEPAGKDLWIGSTYVGRTPLEVGVVFSLPAAPAPAPAPVKGKKSKVKPPVVLPNVYLRLPGKGGILALDPLTDTVPWALSLSNYYEPEGDLGAWFAKDAVGRIRILTVEPNSAAARASLQPGDEIVTIDGRPALDPIEFNEAIRHRPGSPVWVGFLRRGERYDSRIHMGPKRGMVHGYLRAGSLAEGLPKARTINVEFTPEDWILAQARLRVKTVTLNEDGERRPLCLVLGKDRPGPCSVKLRFNDPAASPLILGQRREAGGFDWKGVGLLPTTATLALPTTWTAEGRLVAQWGALFECRLPGNGPTCDAQVTVVYPEDPSLNADEPPALSLTAEDLTALAAKQPVKKLITNAKGQVVAVVDLAQPAPPAKSDED